MNMSEQDESQSKWLRRVADQLYEQQREYSIANTCEEAADAFDALSARCAEMEKYSERLETLAKAFRQMLVKQNRSPYTLNCMTESYLYDDAECDGACLLDDIDSALASQESKT
jgi:hypothetical protein